MHLMSDSGGAQDVPEGCNWPTGCTLRTLGVGVLSFQDGWIIGNDPNEYLTNLILAESSNLPFIIFIFFIPLLLKQFSTTKKK